MMNLLVFDVLDNIAESRMRIGESAIAVLPVKLSFKPMVVVDKTACIIFYVSHQVGYAHSRFQTHEYMNMIRHPVYRKRLLAFAFHNPRDVFVQFFFKRRQDEIASAFHRKHVLNIDWENVPDMINWLLCVDVN